ncbi:MAG: type I-B CRISPR-associated protein Cas7/Csh2 [Chitinophagales bacterium]|jgi:CRISPR-associated protein Csh2|nr:type I-B CRISPR-associated protein Cas7/Csh2 [Chitinophagales bacterium]
MNTLTEKSEIIFLYESTFSTPNGDPFTGEQRYDEETKKVLVSDVRIKRFIRDYLFETGKEIYVINDKSQVAEGSKESGASARMKSLRAKYGNDEDVKSAKKGESAIKLLQKCIDVRLFGAISTEEKEAVNLTGAVQFALLNPSLNSVDLRIHQNTSLFSSSADKSRGAIGTTTVVPYSLCQIHGWVNPYNAQFTGMQAEDLQDMFKALWHSINNVNTRSKSNQNSLLLMQIVYAEKNQKIYGADRFIKIKEKYNKTQEQLRSLDDLEFDFAELNSAANSAKVQEIRFYSEIPQISSAITGLKNTKIKELNLF